MAFAAVDMKLIKNGQWLITDCGFFEYLYTIKSILRFVGLLFLYFIVLIFNRYYQLCIEYRLIVQIGIKYNFALTTKIERFSKFNSISLNEQLSNLKVTTSFKVKQNGKPA